VGGGGEGGGEGADPVQQRYERQKDGMNARNWR